MNSGAISNDVFASFSGRVVASLIDTLLSTVVLFLIAVWQYGDWKAMPSAETNSFQFYLVSAAVVIALWLLMQATPGKAVLHMKIVDAHTGAKPTVWQFLLRYLGYFVSAVPFGLGFIWIAFHPKRQGWHDLLARTVVVRTA